MSFPFSKKAIPIVLVPGSMAKTFELFFGMILKAKDKIELINAQSMVSEGSIDVPYANNLAGLAIDTGKVSFMQ